MSDRPDYIAVFRRSLLQNKAHADALNEAASVLSGTAMDEMRHRAGGDPGEINEVIDALLDKYIATCEGDERVALFGVLCVYGQAMTALAGPLGGRRG